MNAIEILKEEHEEALALIGELETADENGGTDPTDIETFNRLNEALKMHTQIEEELLYSVMEEVDETSQWVRRAYREHDSFDLLLGRLEARAPKQEEFQVLLAELRNELERHIKEEENEFYPKVEEHFSHERLNDLKKQILERKLDSSYAVAAMRSH